MSDALAERLRFAERVAVEAGRGTLELFNAPSFDVITKADGSPVTAADRAAESLLRQRIAETYPDDAILGEEFDSKPGTTGWRWVLDPIDGTKSFVHGVPLYGTMVACEFDGQPRVGVIHMPALDETVAGSVDGHGQTNGWWKPAGQTEHRSLTLSTTAALEQAVVLWTAPEYYRKHGTLHVFHHLEHVVGHQRGWSDCYAFVLLATGRTDAMVEFGLNAWDLAAALPVLIAAGARFTNWQGGDALAEGDLIASNGLVHEALLREVRRAREAE